MKLGLGDSKENYEVMLCEHLWEIKKVERQ